MFEILKNILDYLFNNSVNQYVNNASIYDGCAKCGNNIFTYDKYWHEYSCKQCGLIISVGEDEFIRHTEINGDIFIINGRRYILFKEFDTKVRGVTFTNKDRTSRQQIIAECRVGDEVLFVREPDNPVNKRAVRVITKSGKQIGYLGDNVVGNDQGLGWCVADNLDAGDIYISRIIKIKSYRKIKYVILEVKWLQDLDQMEERGRREEERRRQEYEQYKKKRHIELTKRYNPRKPIIFFVSAKDKSGLEYGGKLFFQFDSKDYYLENPYSWYIDIVDSDGRLIARKDDEVNKVLLKIIKGYFNNYHYDVEILSLGQLHYKYVNAIKLKATPCKKNN